MIGTSDIMEDYEEGYLDAVQMLELFAELIRTGGAWNLGDPYLNEALYLIDAGYVTPGGEITAKGRGLLALFLDEGREGSPCDVNPEMVEEACDDPIPGAVAVPKA
jgi:hypothetical protein